MKKENIKLTIQERIEKESKGKYRIRTGAKSIQEYNEKFDMYIHHKVYTREQDLHDFYKEQVKKIVKRIVVVFMLIFVANCGVDNSGYKEDILTSYVTMFSKKAKAEIPSSLKYMFAKIPINVEANMFILGACFYSSDLVLIHSSTWGDLPEYRKEILMSHELGHCVLDLGHRNKMKEDGCPESMMHVDYTKVTEDCWEEYKEEYYQEFIDVAKLRKRTKKD